LENSYIAEVREVFDTKLQIQNATLRVTQIADMIQQGTDEVLLRFIDEFKLGELSFVIRDKSEDNMIDRKPSNSTSGIGQFVA
jgi:hypothetical protein